MKYIFTILFLTFCYSGVSAQWQQTNGPEGGYTSHLRKVSDYLFVNGQQGGIYRSANGGMTWQEINKGLPVYPHCYYLTSYENKLYASIYANGIYFSDDLGETWMPINNGITAVTSYSLIANGQDIYAGNSEGGFYYSSNHGETWFLHQGVLKNFSIRDFVTSGNKIFAAVNADVENTGVYVSENKGLNWTKLSLDVTNINAMSGFDNALYVSDGSLKLSRDYGVTWESVSLGSGSYVMMAIHAIGNEVNIGASGKAIFYSDDEGGTWTSKLNTAPDNQHTSIYSEGDEFWLATTNGLVYSADGGDNWDEINQGLRNHVIDYLKIDGDTLMAVTTNMGLFSSSDGGNIWSQHSIGTRDWGMNVVSGIYIGDGYKLASTFAGLYRTHSLTKEWVPVILPDGNKLTGVLAGDNDKIVNYIHNEGVYTSPNGGEDWTFKPDELFVGRSVMSSAVKGDTIILGAIDGIFISTDFGDTWEQKTQAGFFLPHSIVFDGSSWFVVAAQGVFRSVNRGQTWSRIDDLPFGFGPEEMVIDENGTYFIGTQSGVYISYNKGVNWYPMNTGLRSPVTALVFQNDRLVCGTFGKSVWAIPSIN
ncbi:MAG TPA: hypothetical protein VK616_11700 [Flavitalea sp.]|nr:hypothetical protein [Flavitalea sp.]